MVSGNSMTLGIGGGLDAAGALLGVCTGVDPVPAPGF
jgi:hypothetical protein